MALILFAFCALLMVVTPLEVSADACSEEEMSQDIRTGVVCNFPWNVCSNHSNFDLSCSTNGEDLKKTMLSCYDHDNSLQCQKLVEDCSYRIDTDNLLFGLDSSTTISCVLHFINQDQLCKASNGQVTTTPPPASSMNSVHHSQHAVNNGGQRAQDPQDLQTSVDNSHSTTCKSELSTDKFIGMAVALASMAILLCVFVVLWLRDRNRRKIKYSLRCDAAVKKLEEKVKALETQFQKCGLPSPGSCQLNLTSEVQKNGTASQPLIDHFTSA